MGILQDFQKAATFFVHSTFNSQTLSYIRQSLTPECNRFITEERSDGVQPPISSFEDFSAFLTKATDVAIITSDSLIDPIANILEENFQTAFQEIPVTHGILNFHSILSSATGRKAFSIRTFLGSFGLQIFGLDEEGREAIPELLEKPYQIFDYAAFFRLSDTLFYISSLTPISMKAAIFVIQQPDLFTIESKASLVKCQYFYKLEEPQHFNPSIFNVSVLPMATIKSNTP